MNDTTPIKRWELALELWKSGVSSTEIGEQLGISQGHAAVLIVRGAERSKHVQGISLGRPEACVA